MIQRLLSALLLLALAACKAAPERPAPAPAQAAPASELDARLAALCEEIEARRVELGVPGLALAVVKDDAVVLARGFGLADVEHGTAVTPETIFACGSTTKGFTAALAAMLVDQGRIAWDEPIARRLPYFVPTLDTADPGAELTLADALSHRSGFTRMSLAWAGGEVGREEVLRTAARAEAWAPFRSTFLYNNLMFVAAGEACAAAAGRSYESLLREHILAPLGMGSTTLSIDAAARDPRLAVGYAIDPATGEERPLPMRRLDHVVPAGGINSNVLDMARWVRLMLGRGALEGRRWIAEERFDDLFAPHVEIGGGAAYGLGWFLREWEGRRVVEHGGNIDGFSAQVGLLPDDGVGYVLLCNTSATPLSALSIDLVFRHVVGEPPQAAPDAPSEDVDALVGRYVGAHGALKGSILTVLVAPDGKLALDVPGQTTYALRPPDADGRRRFEMTDAIAVSFRAIEDGRANVLVLHQHGLDLESPREGWQPPIEVPLAELEPLLGRYAVPGEDEPLELVLLNHHLAVDVPGMIQLELHPPDAHGVRVARATSRFSVQLHVEDGRATGLSFRDGETVLECPRLEPPPPLPSIAEVHALRGTEARAARLAQLGTLRMRSRLFAAQSGVDGEHVELVDGPARHATRIDLGRFGHVATGVDSAGGWEESSFGPAVELSGDRLRQARHGHPWILLGDWRAAFAEERVARRTQVGDRPALELHLIDGDLPPAIVDVDLETGDVLRWREPALGPEGALPTTATFSDHREVDGVRVPFRVAVENDATGRMILDIESFETGIELEDDAFSRPTRK